MKKGKRVKPAFPIEYRLLVAPYFDERANKHGTLVALRTVDEFSNFTYEIIVETSLSGKSLRLHIQGLRAPQVSIPGSGPAVFRTILPVLDGTYSVVVRKLGKDENTFVIQCTRTGVIVKETPHERFIDIVTSEETW